jgi:hypothetical protein
MNVLGWLRKEIEERSIWVGIALVVLAVLIVTYGYNPATKVENTFVEPAAHSLGIAVVKPPCPSGWGYDPAEDSLSIVRACNRGSWRVIMFPDGTANYGYEMDTPGAEFIFHDDLGWYVLLDGIQWRRPEITVPGWPR